MTDFLETVTVFFGGVGGNQGCLCSHTHTHNTHTHTHTITLTNPYMQTRFLSVSDTYINSHTPTYTTHTYCHTGLWPHRHSEWHVQTCTRQHALSSFPFEAHHRSAKTVLNQPGLLYMYTLYWTGRLWGGEETTILLPAPLSLLWMACFFLQIENVISGARNIWTKDG